MCRAGSALTDRPPVVAVGQEGLQGHLVLADKDQQGIGEHRAKGDAGAEGRAERAEAGDKPIAAEGERRQADARAEGAVAHLPAADEVMAHDAVAAQGDDAGREAPDDMTDPLELAAEEDLGEDPFRNKGDDADRQREGEGSELQQPDGDRGLPLLARLLGYLFIFNKADASADVPDALRDAGARVEQSHAAQSPESLDQEIVEAGGEGLRQVVGPGPEAIGEHLAQQSGQANGRASLSLMDDQRDEAVETVEAGDAVGHVESRYVGPDRRAPGHEIEVDEDEEEQSPLQRLRQVEGLDPLLAQQETGIGVGQGGQDRQSVDLFPVGRGQQGRDEHKAARQSAAREGPHVGGDDDPSQGVAVHEIDEGIAAQDAVEDDGDIDRGDQHAHQPDSLDPQFLGVDEDERQVEDRDQVAGTDGGEDLAQHRLEREAVEQTDVSGDRVTDLGAVDVLVRRVRAGRVARADLDGREAHERLVAERRRAEGLLAQHEAPLHERMLRLGPRGVEAEAPGLDLATYLFLDQLEEPLVAVELVRADVDRKLAAVGYDVMLRAGLDDRDRHLDRSQQVALLRELIRTEPVDVLDRLVDGVDTLIAGGVSRLAGGDAIEHHQSLLGDRRTHAGRFAHHGEADRRQLGQDALNAVLARHFLLARGQEDQVVGLRLGAEDGEGLVERDHAGAGVVAAQAVEPVILRLFRQERILLPSGGRLHGVDMRVEEQGRLGEVESRCDNPEVIAFPEEVMAGVAPAFL